MADEQARITVDGIPARAAPGETLLSVCRRAGRDIPTLCHHEAVEPYASCRVCLVEVVEPGGSSLVPSCQFPASDGLSVRTGSRAVRDARRVVLELLLARCPASDVVRDLAARHGVTGTPYPSDEPDQTCILCGLCVRVCEQLVGAAAIGFSQRGVERNVASPFDEQSDACIGCGACAAVCPTGHVRGVVEGRLKRMETWNTQLELAECETCGRLFAPTKQIEHVGALAGEKAPVARICRLCRRSRTAEQLSRIAELVGRCAAG